jgi:putative acetyltransferase
MTLPPKAWWKVCDGAGKKEEIAEMDRMTIRLETAGDASGIAALLKNSFPTTAAEAELTERLRADGDAVLPLLAEAGMRIAAYAMFARMTAPFRAMGLGPVAADAALRRRGLASALIRDGLLRARTEGWDACFVLGNPSFYGRFGFRADLAAGFDCAYAGPNFMCMALQPGGLPVSSGRVEYARAFG